jgi:hypothetical protein
MSTQHAADSQPHIHLWVTSREAADMLHCDERDIHEQMDSGDLDTRVTEAGVEEVLICLPSRDPLMPADEVDELTILEDQTSPQATSRRTTSQRTAPQMRVEAAPEEDPELVSGVLPMMQALRWTQADGIKRARRSAKIAWAIAATLVFTTIGSIAAVVLEASMHRRQLETMADEVQSVSDANTRLAGDKIELARDLQELRQSNSKIQEELAVDREVEDTLLKAAVKAKGGVPANNATAMADVATQ